MCALIRPFGLRCEYTVNPLGIDAKAPRLSWILEADRPERRGLVQKAYRIQVASELSLLEEGTADLWDTGMVESDRSIHIEYAGKELKSGMVCWWRVKVWDPEGVPSEYSDPAYWSMGILDRKEWVAEWIGLPNSALGIPEDPGEEVQAPSPYLRRSFQVAKPVKRAILHSTALGLYMLSLNGRRVGDELFAPGWTDYSKRIQYQTYDVTDLLSEGENVIGAILGDGWYAGNIAAFGRFNYGKYPLRLLLQMKVEYRDGSFDIVKSDGNWRGAPSPILNSDILMGESYDARREIPGWDMPGFDDGGWHPVVVLGKADGGWNPVAVSGGVGSGMSDIGAELVSQRGPGVKVTEELKPIAVTKPAKGVYIFDMGQNMVGRVRLKVKGERGEEIVLRFGEMLQPDGSLYTENLRSAKQTDRYICRGSGGEETFSTYFTYHGFRYVEMTGYSGEVDFDTVTGEVMHSATPRSGFFETSDPMVNRLQANILWGQRGNYFSIPTDCPQRDERLGWLGDAQVFVRTASLNMDVAGFFHKWMRDVTEAQEPSGSFTCIAPWVQAKEEEKKWPLKNGSAAWGDAGVIIPWTIYLCYGYTRIIEENYEAMARWINYMKKTSTGLLRPDEGYGDWLNIDAETPKDLLGTAYFAYCAKLMARMAQAVGKAEDSARYEALFKDIKEAFCKAYVSPDGRIKGETQTCYLLALQMELFPEELRQTAAKYLVEDIERRGWHLSTGFVGVGYLLPILTKYGYPEVAYRILLNDTYPSWGYSIKNGATTIWERWNSYTAEKGFEDPIMNSFNHYSLGSVGEWFYRFVAGIDADPERPGYKHIIIRPTPGGGLTYAKGEYNSVHGIIKSEWHIEGDIFYLSVSIPVNTTATLCLPLPEGGEILESGKALDQAEGICNIIYEDGFVKCGLGSGSYRFVMTGFPAVWWKKVPPENIWTMGEASDRITSNYCENR